MEVLGPPGLYGLEVSVEERQPIEAGAQNGRSVRRAALCAAVPAEVRKEKIPVCYTDVHKRGEIGLKTEFTIMLGDKQADLCFGESLRKDFTHHWRLIRVFVYALKLIGRVILFVSSWWIT